MAASTDELVSQIRQLAAEDKQLTAVIEAFEEPWNSISIPESLIDTDMNGAAFRAEAAGLRATADTADQIASQLDVMEKNAAEAEASRASVQETYADLFNQLWELDEELSMSLDTELNG